MSPTVTLTLVQIKSSVFCSPELEVKLPKFLTPAPTFNRQQSQAATMGWFWGSSDGDDGKKSQDPFRDLDPSLREFLAKESPVKYSSSNPPSTQPTTLDTQNAQTDSRTGSATPKSTSSDAEPKVPRESLYQDGRYAHLWKRYQAQAEIDNAFKTDQEKLQDVLDGYSQRKTEIGRAALENCALEQWEVNECFRSGGWQKRLTMCRTENRGFERCYLMQGVCENTIPVYVKLSI